MNKVDLIKAKEMIKELMEKDWCKKWLKEMAQK